MIFNVPVKIYEERGCVCNHSSELAELGDHALIVTGRHSSKNNGSLDDLRAALDSEGVLYTIFDEVEENPSVETVIRARDIGIEAGVDFVVGLGGGSPMDAAKAIAIMLCYPECGGELLYDRSIRVSSRPVAAIPTTCGTGSEATAVSVLTVHEKKTKASLPHRVFPTLALVDAGYLKYAPCSVITATAVDAFAHLVESYINTAVSPYVKMLTDSGLAMWGSVKDVIAGDREPCDSDYDALIHTSTLAGMAIAHDGTTIPHSLSYNITYELGVPHGTAVGYFIPGYLREATVTDRSYILNRAGFADMDAMQEFIDKTCRVPLLNDEIISRSIQSVLNNPAKLKACPFNLTQEILMRMVKQEHGGER